MLDIILWGVEIAIMAGILIIELIQFKKDYATGKQNLVRKRNDNLVLAG